LPTSSGPSTATTDAPSLASAAVSSSSLSTLECSICFDAIDVRDRRQYMLAPCDHLFHRDCLIRWMDQKMECPTCRRELPAL
jgi:hypothetical protein